MRPVNEIIVHCTATRPEWWASRTLEQKIAEVRKWHVDPPPAGRGWKDIGYHYLIDRDGLVLPGRPVERIGAHVAGRNTGTIGIALFGGHGSSALDEFAEHFTPEQDAALRALIADLRKRFPSIITVSGHNQYSAKACPGFRVPKWYPAGVPFKGAPVHPASNSHQTRPAQAPKAPPAVEIGPAPQDWLARLLAALATWFKRNM